MQEKRKVGSITKIGDEKYRIRISCGFDDYGKRQVLQRVVIAKSDTEAEKIMMEMYVNREKELRTRHSAPSTLEDLYNEWTRLHVSKLAPSTQEFYERLWKRIENKGKIKLQRIKPGNVYDIIVDMVPDEQARTKCGVFKMLKTMFGKAVKWEYMNSNPCEYLDAPKYTPPEKKILKESDALAVLNRIEQEETKYQAAFFLACVCSLRRQEVVGLRWEYIDFKTRTFEIKKVATRAKGKGTFTKEPKTKKSRRKLHMTDTIYFLLLRLQNEQIEAKTKLGNLYRDEGFVFTQWDGGIMDLGTVSHWWKTFRESLDSSIDVENVTYHSLRHTAATYMIKNNVPISTVSGVLGHSNITTTLNTYTHVIEDTKQAAIQTVDNIFSLQKEEKRDVI